MRQRVVRWWVWIPLCCVLTACATPVGVVRVDPQDVHRELTRNVLSSDVPSRVAMNVLEEHNLAELYDDDPEKALAALHLHATGDAVRGSALFALAELSFLHAERSNTPSYHLASAVYAFAFLFPEAPAAPPDPFYPRLRVATDLYNRSVTAAFKAADGFHVELVQPAHADPTITTFSIRGRKN